MSLWPGDLRLFVLGLAITLLALFPLAAYSQETRGTLIGTVRDASGAVVAGAEVRVARAGTGVQIEITTNEEGFFSLPYLIAGTYQITVTRPGFKKYLKEGLRVTTEGRHSLDVVLEPGAVTEQVTVVGRAIEVDTASATGATVLSRELVSELPLYGGNANRLAALAPGVHSTGAFIPISGHDIRPQVAVTVAGGVGFPEFAVDGIANRNERGRISLAPHTDTVEELKVDTANFDASQGHTSNIRVSLITKSGTNDYHGALSWQHWQQRWNATPTLIKSNRALEIAAADAAGRTAYANELRNKPFRPSGRSNTYSATVGGPVVIPKIFDGHNQLFFFFGVNGYKENKTTEGFFTVPTEAQRNGDFSNLLKLSQPIVIHDPRTARRDGARVVRDPFPNNQVPILNPMYRHYVKYFPLPNNSPLATEEGINNYFAGAIPQIWDYRTLTNRVDWYISPRHKMFGRWHWSNFDEDTGDFAYEAVRGLSADRFNRKSWAAVIDHVFTVNSTTNLNFSVAYQHYEDGNVQTDIQINTGAADVGLPSYLDEKAGDFPVIPRLGIDGYATITPGRRSGYNRYTIGIYRGELAKTLGNHSAKTGFDVRDLRRSEFFPSNTTGNFVFGRDYTRRTDQPSSANTDIGLAWAAFMLGVPRSVVIPTRTPSDRGNLAYAFYVHDDWRVTPRLTLNLGLRFERENGAVEVENRFVNYFNATATLPISAAAEAAYLARPIPEVAKITVRGGSAYADTDGAPRELTRPESMFMPRLGAAYRIGNETVIRAGYGWFFDSYSALDFDADNSGFTRDTSTPISNDLGLTFNNADLARGITLLNDPFPLRADGTRFNEPVGARVGLLARAGRSFGFNGDNWRRPRQQRWRAGVQHGLFRNIVVEAAYLGSHTDRIPVNQPLNPMPREYYIIGMDRNIARENDLNANVPNPFNIANFAFLQQQNPFQYQELLSQGFFTSTTIRKNHLLRPFPHMTGLNDSTNSIGEASYHHLEISANLRTSLFKGQTSYVFATDRRRTTFDNEFDTELMWLPNNSSRPHTLKFFGVFDLPFGRNQRFLSSGVLGAIFGGWQVGTIYTYQSGEWFNFGNIFYYGANLDDIELSGNEQSPANWFNTAGFEHDRNKQPSAFHVRVFPRDFGLRADAAHALEANIARNFSLTERHKLQFRADFLNLPNNVQWGLPSTDPANSNFGKATSQRNAPRLIQFQLRYSF